MKEYCFYQTENRQDKNKWEKFAVFYTRCIKEKGEFNPKRDLNEACQFSGYTAKAMTNILKRVILPTVKNNGYILTENGTFIDPNESDYSL